MNSSRTLLAIITLIAVVIMVTIAVFVNRRPALPSCGGRIISGATKVYEIDGIFPRLIKGYRSDTHGARYISIGVDDWTLLYSAEVTFKYSLRAPVGQEGDFIVNEIHVYYYDKSYSFHMNKFYNLEQVIVNFFNFTPTEKVLTSL